ncbi:hypothetical protein OZL92_17075 [Bacillus sonorensis]|uniref:hypothetical protein n=1 Tax=Bacillus sonorensis TaxID=119858 RepID=UPI000349F7DD|nr:hypothetical protein [Bacillus sonorensis]MCZ0075403.1 hypothetical protein [Bacillus sonorensis]MCZ0093058.1 hypothetical protein [Bacillus sonorensis]
MLKKDILFRDGIVLKAGSIVEVNGVGERYGPLLLNQKDIHMKGSCNLRTMKRLLNKKLF